MYYFKYKQGFILKKYSFILILVFLFFAGLLSHEVPAQETVDSDGLSNAIIKADDAQFSAQYQTPYTQAASYFSPIFVYRRPAQYIVDQVAGYFQANLKVVYVYPRTIFRIIQKENEVDLSVEDQSLTQAILDSSQGSSSSNSSVALSLDTLDVFVPEEVTDEQSVEVSQVTESINLDESVETQIQVSQDKKELPVDISEEALYQDFEGDSSTVDNELLEIVDLDPDSEIISASKSILVTDDKTIDDFEEDIAQKVDDLVEPSALEDTTTEMMDSTDLEFDVSSGSQLILNEDVLEDLNEEQQEVLLPPDYENIEENEGGDIPSESNLIENPDDLLLISDYPVEDESASDDSLIDEVRKEEDSAEKDDSLGLIEEDGDQQPDESAEEESGLVPMSIVEPDAYPSDQFIVKFKSDWPYSLEACAHCLLEDGYQFQHYLSDGSNSIDELNRICRVKSAKNLFINRHHMTTDEALQIQNKMIETVKAKYPQRTLRSVNPNSFPNLVNVYTIEVTRGSDIKKICQLYENDPHVEYAHPNYIMSANAFPTDPPNDTLYSSLYALNNTGQTGGTVDADIDAPEAWMLNLGAGMVVAVIDTGVEWTHVDLAANIWSNTDEIVNGADTDGNGFIDDIRGWDFVDDDNDPDPADDSFHGTFVAAIIAAIADNSEGVIGIAPSAQIMSIRGLNAIFGTTADLAEAINYAANNGADVLNNSWGCISPCPSNPTIESAVLTAYGLGAVIVFGAGNDTLDVANFSPQNMVPETIAVGATDDDDAIASFSNFGSALDIVAPGVAIVSATLDSQYTTSQGTSFSAPYASGVAALVLSHHTALNFTNEEIRKVLRDTSDDLGTAGFDTTFGAGRLNAQKALGLTGCVNSCKICGDGVCRIDGGAGETCSNCPEDCGPCQGLRPR